MSARDREDKPRPSLRVTVEPTEAPATEPEAGLPIIENIGRTGAEIFRSLVHYLATHGMPMSLVSAEFEVQVEAMVMDESIFSDDEEHRSILVFRGRLERE